MGAQERFRSGGDAVGRRRGGQAVAREACALVDDGDAPIKALVDLDERLGIAAPTARREQLDQFRPKGDGVVVADRALVFEAEDGLGIEACGPRTIGGSRIGRLLGEAGIEARKEVPQEGIRALAIEDAGEAQFARRRSWQVPKSRSMRPFACGLWAGTHWMPSSCRARATCVEAAFPASCSWRVRGVVFLRWKMPWRSLYTATGMPFVWDTVCKTWK